MAGPSTPAMSGKKRGGPRGNKTMYIVVTGVENPSQVRVVAASTNANKVIELASTAGHALLKFKAPE